MVEVHRLNGAEFFINPDLIKQIDVTPDTIVTFTDGHTVALKDSAKVVVEKIIEFRQRCRNFETK